MNEESWFLLYCCLECLPLTSISTNVLSLIWQIRIDGQDTSEVTLESLRKTIGVVPQDTVKLGNNFMFLLEF